MKKKSAPSRGFSLIELSIVILVISLLAAGIMQGSRVVAESRLENAQLLTTRSAVNEIDNLIAWYEPSLPSSFDTSVTKDGDLVANWYDNNPNAVSRNNAVQAVSASQPKFFSRVVNMGIPAIRFDGVDDFLEIANQLPDLAGGSYSIFFVEQRRSSGRNFFFGGSSTVNDNNLTLGYNSDTVVRHDHYSSDAANRIDFTVSGYSSPQLMMHSFLFNTSDGKKYWNNGGSAADGTSSYNAALSSFPNPYIGRVTSFYFNGDIAEIIIFNRYLKTEERRAVEDYLSKKYGIAIS